jgi:hypothetical protein
MRTIAITDRKWGRTRLSVLISAASQKEFCSHHYLKEVRDAEGAIAAREPRALP